MPDPRRFVPSSSLVFAFVLAVAFSGARATAAPAPGPGVVSVSPVDGARFVRRHASIVVRFAGTTASDDAVARIRVHGASSGEHTGRVRVSAQRGTVRFIPDTPFAAGELVEVSLSPPAFDGHAAAEVRTSFEVAAREVALPPGHDDAPGLREDASGALPFMHADAALDLPAVHTTFSPGVAPGSVFLSSFRLFGTSEPWLLEVDDAGTAQFARQMSLPCYDFKVQPDGRRTYFDSSLGAFVALDAQGAAVDTFACGDGYTTDLHELRVLPDGGALLMSYDPQVVDMSAVVAGGDTAATVIGLVVQELDAAHDVVFEWRSWDHYAITDAVAEDLTAHVIDYVHGNALELDADGGVLISARHLDEITKVDRVTGDIVWRWGGKHNEFDFLVDTLHFSHQHAIRRLANGHYTLFDNGNGHAPNFSRAVEYALDPDAHTATTVWEYGAPGGIYGFAMGYVQRLDNGNTLIGWGAASPAVTEVTPTGENVFELSFDPGIFSYRAYRFPFVPVLSAGEPDAGVGAIRLACAGGPVRGRGLLRLESARTGAARVRLFDIGGRLVGTPLPWSRIAAGANPIAFDAGALAPGVYLARAEVRDDGAEVRQTSARVVVLK